MHKIESWQVVENSANSDMLLKVKRGEKEEKFEVEIHMNHKGTLHLNQMVPCLAPYFGPRVEKTNRLILSSSMVKTVFFSIGERRNREDTISRVFKYFFRIKIFTKKMLPEPFEYI